MEALPSLENLFSRVNYGLEYPQQRFEGRSMTYLKRLEVLLFEAASFRRSGMDFNEIKLNLQFVRDVLFDSSQEPVTDEDLASISAWICQLNPSYENTDRGNLQRFLDQHGSYMRYSYENKFWIGWTGKNWSVGDGRLIERRAQFSLRSIRLEAAALSDEAARQALSSHAKRSGSYYKVTGLLKAAQPYLTVEMNEFNRHPNLLNLRNGILDLRTGELSPHDPALLMTHLVDIDYLPGAFCPAWLEFLEMVTGGNSDLQRYLQVCLGYSLTGESKENVFFFLVGDGKNGTGKTTLMRTLGMIMGSYATKLPSHILRKSARLKREVEIYLATLFGVRLAHTSEIQVSIKLNEPLLMKLIGSERITGCQMYRKQFSFKPSHKLWIVGCRQFPPKNIGGELRSQMRMIPFRHSIPTQKLRGMSEVLQTFEEEKEGILAWMVAGAMRWYTEGLGSAEQDFATPVKHRSDQDDVVGQFLANCCLMEAGHKLCKDQLYQAWQSWCQENGKLEHRHKSKNWLTHKLGKLGFRSGGQGRRFYIGLKLTS